MSPFFGRKSSRNLKKSKSKNSKDTSIKNIFLNSLIFILTVFIGVFIYSFSTKQMHNGKSFEITFPPTSNPPPLSTIYENNPIDESQVEVLNGCGIQGIAGKFSRYLRDNNIDVLNSDDADHYNYTHTLIISRTGDIQILDKVSSLLGFDLKDKNHILNKPDSGSEFDLTVIIGSDYTSIKPVMEFWQNQN
jgi:hypothetical protein|tara:strand:+ start:64 stop:636 length:573 start_codon:yes stop_codon:yes gene_type:complete